MTAVVFVAVVFVCVCFCIQSKRLFIVFMSLVFVTDAIRYQHNVSLSCDWNSGIMIRQALKYVTLRHKKSRLSPEQVFGCRPK